MHTIYDEIGGEIAQAPAWGVRAAIASAHRCGYSEVIVDDWSERQLLHMAAQVNVDVNIMQCLRAQFIEAAE